MSECSVETRKALDKWFVGRKMRLLRCVEKSVQIGKRWWCVFGEVRFGTVQRGNPQAKEAAEEKLILSCGSGMMAQPVFHDTEANM